MKYTASRCRAPRGAAMLMVLALAIIGGIALTSWMYLMGARLQQAEHQLDQVTRSIAWGNSSAINQQYALGYAFRDYITQNACTAVLTTGWGGSDQSAISGISAFRILNTASNPSLWNYPFNNVRNVPTSDNSVYYVRTDGDSDSSQSEHVTFYNYEMTYPTALSGDLLSVHTKPSGASGSTSICKNLLVSGRTVIYDSTANVTAVKTSELINQTKTGTNIALNTAGTTLMPTNFPATPHFTAGYGGSTVPNAVLDGSLNVINNANFTPGSIVDIMTTMGGYTNVSAGSASGSTSTAVQVVLQTTPTYPPPTTSPYSYTYTSPFNVVTVRLVPPSGATLGHLRINGSVDQLVLQGQTTSADYTTGDTLTPVIIWLEQEARDIRLVGENNRRLILVVGNGTGQVLYMGFSGTSILGGSNPLRWRLHLINQYRNIYFDQPSGKNITITGGIRTNWSINDTDTTSTTRITLQRETSPGALATLLPRDGWIAPYFVTK